MRPTDRTSAAEPAASRASSLRSPPPATLDPAGRPRRLGNYGRNAKPSGMQALHILIDAGPINTCAHTRDVSMDRAQRHLDEFWRAIDAAGRGR